MSQFVEAATKTFTAGAAIGKDVIVRLSGGKLAAAGVSATDDFLGTTEQASFANGDTIAVRLRTAPGTHKCIAGLNSIAAGDIVYTAANGQVNKTATSNTRVGVALEASSAVGDVIEVLMD